MRNCRIFLEEDDIFNIFEDDFFTNIPLKFLNKGEVCYPETPRILIIKKGKLKISLYEKDEFILYFVYKNNFCFCNNDIIITAKEDSEFYFLESCHFSKLFSNIQFCNLLLKNINKNLYVEIEIIKSLAFKTANSRIAEFLYEAANTIGKKEKNNIILELHCNMEEIASFLGISRQYLSGFLNFLIDKKIIEKKGYKSIVVKDLLKIKEFFK